jgi:hypothetical protein
MVVSPLLRGLFGLSVDANAHLLSFAPHVPADWASFAIRNVHVGSCALDLKYERSEQGFTLEADRSGSGECTLEFSPAISPLAEVMTVEMNGHLVQHRVLKSAVDQHVVVRFPVNKGTNKLHVVVHNDFGLSVPAALPELGGTSRGLRVLAETWTAAKDRLELEVSGVQGSTYELGVWNAGQLSRVDGAEWNKGAGGHGQVRVHVAIAPYRTSKNVDEGAPATNYTRQKMVFYFAAR